MPSAWPSQIRRTCLAHVTQHLAVHDACVVPRSRAQGYPDTQGPAAGHDGHRNLLPAGGRITFHRASLSRHVARSPRIKRRERNPTKAGLDYTPC